MYKAANNPSSLIANKIAVFLDRDGTIIVDKHYLKDPEQVELLDGAQEAIKNLKSFPCSLFLLTNQSGISRGIMTMDDVTRCNDRMATLLDTNHQVFDEICVAAEMPYPFSKEISGYGYRKPSPRFILEMIREHNLSPANCYMVGDKITDALTGINASVNSVLLSEQKKLPTELTSSKVKIFKSLLEFSSWLTDAQSIQPQQNL